MKGGFGKKWQLKHCPLHIKEDTLKKLIDEDCPRFLLLIFNICILTYDSRHNEGNGCGI